jgi:hypothetical protein
MWMTETLDGAEPPAERGSATGIQVIARAAEILRLLQAIPPDSRRPRSPTGSGWPDRRFTAFPVHWRPKGWSPR